MAFATLTCPACGAREVVRREGGFSCAYCKARVVPRLLPGTLCEDQGAALHCGKPAETLCRACARPLCDRHNDPKQLYWHEPLHWRNLCPGWSAQDGVGWERLQRPVQRLPVEGFEPFAWTPHDRNMQYEIGQLETEIFERAKPLAQAAGGDIDDQAVRFHSVCADCERETGAAIRAAVSEFALRYRERAYRERLRALRAETEQAVRYVEAFLRRRIARRPAPADAPFGGVDAGSPPQDWDHLGQELQRRLATIERLSAALAAEP